ncbi:GntR family transcriptional regulator [Actinomarinicola tropica]|nr:GntR family transcriptional regulator [Actinomarinicola tropica]
MSRSCSDEARAPHRRRRSDDARQVADLLRAQILQGLHGEGPLPMEDHLVRAHGVSRNAVREALDLLRAEGLVERRQGAGTFVVARKAMHDFDRLRSIADSVQATGEPRFETITAQLLPAPSTVATALAVGDGEPAVLLERLMVVDGTPLSIRSSWMPGSLAEPLLGCELDRLHYYRLVRSVLGIELTRGHLVIEAVVAGAGAASLLGVPDGAPLFLMERTSYLADGRPFEFGFTRSRADRVALVADMQIADTGDPSPSGRWRNRPTGTVDPTGDGAPQAAQPA